MTPGPGIEPGPHWWEASALTTAPTLLPLMRTLSIDSTEKFPDDKDVIDKTLVEGQVSRIQISYVPIVITHESVCSFDCKGSSHSDTKRLMKYIAAKLRFKKINLEDSSS